MPNYYNPNLFYPATYVNPYSQMMQQPTMAAAPMSTSQYMINVDGEGSARAWQPQTPIGPNTIIPLWDLDGQHLYFKSTDAYGRMNPIRKARVVFEDEARNIGSGQNDAGTGSQSQQASQTAPDMSQYVTRQDFDGLRQDIQNLRNMLGQKNQNGRNYEPKDNRGDSK